MKARFKITILLLLIVTGTASAQTVYYVDGTVSSSGDGTNWAQAFKTIKEGIDAASASLTNPSSDTAEVWVKEGTYYIYKSGVDNTISMAEGVMIYGGFDGTESQRSERDWENNVTILDGHQSEGSSNQVEHVVTAYGNEISTDVYESWSNGLIDGFTITGGKISVGPGKGSSKATDPESILASADGSAGAGILIFKCGPNVSNCKIIDNTAIKGGGIYVVTATEWPTTGGEPKPTIYNCEISDNYATSRGGGIALDVGSEPTFINCKIQNNTCAAKGGGIYIDWVCPEPIFINCLFSGNYAARAGALGADGSSSPLLINCSVVNNSAEDIGAGFYTGSYNPDGTGSNNPTLINCIVWGNRCEWGGPTDIRIWHENYFATSHSALGEGFTSYGDGVIYQDPEITDTTGGDYSLSSSSPCINAGTSSDALDTDNLIPNYDIDGNPRDGSPDMGCYEFTGVTCTDYSNTVDSEICEGDSLFAGGNWQKAAGTYYDSLLTVNNCDSIIITNLTVTELPDAPVITQDGDTLFSNESEGNQWYLDNEAINGANDDQYICTANGDYSATITSLNGCESVASNVITVVLTGVEILSNLEITIYPNPAQDRIYISGLTGITEQTTLYIYDINGSQLFVKKAYQDCNIDISSFDAGIYLLKVSNSDSSKTVRIIKQ